MAQRNIMSFYLRIVVLILESILLFNKRIQIFKSHVFNKSVFFAAGDMEHYSASLNSKRVLRRGNNIFYHMFVFMCKTSRLNIHLSDRQNFTDAILLSSQFSFAQKAFQSLLLTDYLLHKVLGEWQNKYSQSKRNL